MAKRILAVEDDPDILFIVEMILKEEGYEVFTSPDGKNILLEVETVHPDLVVMDIRLPDADGRDLCKDIKNYYRNLPVILMSAHAEYSKVIEEACADDFIAKPFDISEFIRRIQNKFAA
jgi:DNA-binding response OmpR family regulator